MDDSTEDQPIAKKKRGGKRISVKDDPFHTEKNNAAIMDFIIKNSINFDGKCLTQVDLLKSAGIENPTDNQIKNVAGKGTRIKSFLFGENNETLWRFNKHWCYLEKVPQDVQQHFPSILQILEKNKKNFEMINNSEEILWQLPVGKLIRNDSKIQEDLKSFFKELNEKNDHKWDESFLFTGMQTRVKDNSKLYSQMPHTDYQNKFIRKPHQTLAWAAVMPLTEHGSWLYVWFSAGYPKYLHIPKGQVFFFRSDFVHAGGRVVPWIDKDVMFTRLHFYLSTKFQPADTKSVGYKNTDNKTLLYHTHVVPQKFKSERENKHEKNIEVIFIECSD